MCNIVEKFLMLKIGPLNLLLIPKSGSRIRPTTSGNIRYPESGKFDIRYIPTTSLLWFGWFILRLLVQGNRKQETLSSSVSIYQQLSIPSIMKSGCCASKMSLASQIRCWIGLCLTVQMETVHKTWSVLFNNNMLHLQGPWAPAVHFPVLSMIMVLGALIYRRLTFDSHVAAICKTCNYHIWALYHIHWYLPLRSYRP